MKYRNRRSDSSDFPSISSNSTRSDLIREVENLIVLAGEAKIRMRKKKEDSEEFLQKTIDLKKRVDELFPDERIKKLMEWKYLWKEGWGEIDFGYVLNFFVGLIYFGDYVMKEW